MSPVSAMEVSNQNSQDAYLSFFEEPETGVTSALEGLTKEERAFIMKSGCDYKGFNAKIEQLKK